MLTLNKICQSASKQEINHFSDDIKASINFYKNTTAQTNYLDMFLKPVHTLMFTQIKGHLSCTLLTQQETQEFINNPSIQNRFKNSWLSTTQHHMLHGTPPQDIRTNHEYQKLIEQVRFFNGEFSLLLSGDIKLNWALEQSKEKIKWFEQYLLANHEVIPKEFKLFKNKLLSNMMLYQFIIKNPRIDAEQIDWNSKYPDLEDNDIDEAKSLSRVLNKLVVDWETIDLDSASWHKDYMLSITALAFLRQIINELRSIKYLISWLKNPIDIKQSEVQAALNTLKIESSNSTLDIFEALYDVMERKKLETSLELLTEAKVILTEDKELWAQTIKENSDLSISRANLNELLKKNNPTLTAFQLKLLVPLLKNILRLDCLTEEEFEVLFQASELDMTFIDGLIANNSSVVTNQLSRILQFDGLTQQKLKGLCARKNLPDAFYFEATQKAETLQIKSELFEVFLRASSPIPEPFLLKLAGDLSIPNTMQLLILMKAPTMNIKVALVALLLKNEVLAPDFFLAVLSDTELLEHLKSDAMDAMISHLSKLSTDSLDIIKNNLFEQIVTNKKINEQLKVNLLKKFEAHSITPPVNQPLSFGLIALLKNSLNHFTFNFIFTVLNQLSSSISIDTKHHETITHKHEYRFSVMTQSQKEDLIKAGLVELNLVLGQEQLDPKELEQKFAQLCKSACARRGKIGALFSPYSVHTHAAKALVNKFKDHQGLLSALKIDTNKNVKAQLIQKMQDSLNGTNILSGPNTMNRSN